MKKLTISTDQQRVLEATIELFNQKGLKLTMDDLAKEVGMSKKTLYVLFEDKQALFLKMVDYVFQSIKESEQKVLDDPSLSTVEKIEKIMGVLPEGYKTIDFRQLYPLKEKYPKVYQKVSMHLESDWENTIQLIEQGMQEGVVRKVSIPIVQMMLEASLEQFFQRDILIENQMTYQEALEEVVRIIVNGIAY